MKNKPHLQLLVALVLGASLGMILNPFKDDATLQFLMTNVLGPVGQIFLRLIFMVVVPLVFSALVLGVSELGQAQGVGGTALKTLGYTFLTSTASVLIGVGLVNLIQPGKGLVLSPEWTEAASQSLNQIKTNASNSKSAAQAIVELIPKNPLDSAVRALDGEMIAFMFFALFVGLAWSHVRSDEFERNRDSVLHRLLEETLAISMRIVEFALKLAPIAVFALVFNTALKFGYTIFVALFYYVVVVVLGLLVQQFIVYSILLKSIAKMSPKDFFFKIKDVMVYAFATASSNATLPRALHAATYSLDLKPKISRFVLTVGASANQNGTALFEGITVLFLAQVYGIDLSLSSQIQVILMSILAGIGTAGVPGGSLPLIMILIQQVGIPAEGLGIILGVDRFLDMCRTTVNVTGDLVIASLVSKSSR